jgi:lipoprotein-anchoring transpeptidase ErfK/SrfK
VGIARSVTAPPSPAAEETTASPAASPAPSPAVQPGAGAPVVTATPSGPDDSDAEASPADSQAASAAAQRFASLWLAGAFVDDRTRWVDSMSDLVDPSLRPFLVATPASAIPRTSVASTVPQLVAPTFGAVRVTFADGTGMDLQMSATGSSWRVVQYLPTATR